MNPRATVVTLADIAPLMGVSARTLRRWIDEGTIPEAAVLRAGVSNRKRIRLRVDVLRQCRLLTTEVAP